MSHAVRSYTCHDRTGWVRTRRSTAAPHGYEITAGRQCGDRHMTAYLVVLWAYEGLGGTLPAEPTAGWWAQRWLWLLAPSAVLAVLVAVFARVELAVRKPRARASR